MVSRRHAPASRITAALFRNVIAAFVMAAPISYFLTRDVAPDDELQPTLRSNEVQVRSHAGVASVLFRATAEVRGMADANAGFV